ncbi:MAG: HAD family hydrolase [Hyphomicrobiales bacterium]
MARLVLFDIDMTLISTLRAGRAALEVSFRENFGIEGAVSKVSIDGRTDHAIFMELIAIHGVANGDIEAAYRRTIEGYLAALPGEIAARNGHVLPGVPALLDALEISHGKLGLATGNIRPGAKIKLSHFGLWERFAAGGFGDASPVRAEVVHAGMEELAAALGLDPNPGDTVIVGDTPLDVEAAHAIGAKAIAVATGAYSVDDLERSGADAAFADLSSTSEVLGAISSL